MLARSKAEFVIEVYRVELHLALLSLPLGETQGIQAGKIDGTGAGGRSAGVCARAQIPLRSRRAETGGGPKKAGSGKAGGQRSSSRDHYRLARTP